MGKIRNVAVAMATFGAALATPAPAHAQDVRPIDVPAADATSPNTTLEGATVILKVDGLTCPFCAYGLEKRLKESPAIDAVLILVSDGLVQLRWTEGLRLEDEDLAAVVDRAGFTLTEVQRVSN